MKSARLLVTKVNSSFVIRSPNAQSGSPLNPRWLTWIASNPAQCATPTSDWVRDIEVDAAANPLQNGLNLSGGIRKAGGAFVVIGNRVIGVRHLNSRIRDFEKLGIAGTLPLPTCHEKLWCGRCIAR